MSSNFKRVDLLLSSCLTKCYQQDSCATVAANFARMAALDSELDASKVGAGGGGF